MGSGDNSLDTRRDHGTLEASFLIDFYRKDYAS